MKKQNLFGSKYLILKNEGPSFGLFTYYINFLGEVEWAIANDMIPVIDMRTYKNSIHREGEVGKVNTWDIFYEQPCGVGLDEALASGKARYYWRTFAEHRPEDSLDFLYNDELVADYHRVAEKYMRINSKIKEHLDDVYAEKIAGKRCLGVLARGTDYSDFKPYSNPIQPSVKQLIPCIDSYMQRYELSHIFVATEDGNILDELQTIYGEKLLYVEQDRFRNINSYLYDDSNFQKVDPVTVSTHYMESIYLLSKCEGIVAGRTSGTVAAIVMADNYKFKHIWTLGRYGIDDNVLNRIV